MQPIELTNLYIKDYLWRPMYCLYNYKYEFEQYLGLTENYNIIDQLTESINQGIFDIHLNNYKYCDNIKIRFDIGTTNRHNDIDTLVVNSKWDEDLHKFNTIQIHIFLTHKEFYQLKAFDSLRYSLLIIYYRYLEKIDPNNEYVKFLQYLSNLDFQNIFAYLHNYIVRENIKEWNSDFFEYTFALLSKRKQKKNKINEDLFYNLNLLSNRIFKRKEWDKVII